MKYTTKHSQGSVGYRAIELLNTDDPSFTKASDIWALGCILYELSYRKKAFTDDIAAWQYGYKPDKFRNLDRLEVSERTAACIRELIRRMLEIDWWKRPTARDILQLLESLLKNYSWPESVFYVRETESESESSSSSILLAPATMSDCISPSLHVDTFSSETSLLNPQDLPLPPTRATLCRFLLTGRI